MTSKSANPNFSTLLTVDDAKALLQQLIELEEVQETNNQIKPQVNEYLRDLTAQWQHFHNDKQFSEIKNNNTEFSEQFYTDWLIALFDILFTTQRVKLVRGDGEPEYFPASDHNLARIEFAHGFFASALHEISHWCVAGEKRRKLADFGYWYAADGRTAVQQQAFERVEIKPQALECLFTLACRRPFQVSQDNLFANFDTSTSTFANDVYQQASQYIARPQYLPRDAKVLLKALLSVCSNN